MSIRIKRLIASFIDYYIICMLSCVVVAIVTLGEMDVSSVSLIAFFITFVVSIVFKDAVFKGASIGKLIFRIKVVKTDNSKLKISDYFKRNITILLVSLEVILLIAMNKRLGDMWAKTMVVNRNTD